jgi:hypothetical protein
MMEKARKEKEEAVRKEKEKARKEIEKERKEKEKERKEKEKERKEKEKERKEKEKVIKASMQEKKKTSLIRMVEKGFPDLVQIWSASLASSSAYRSNVQFTAANFQEVNVSHLLTDDLIKERSQVYSHLEDKTRGTYSNETLVQRWVDYALSDILMLCDLRDYILVPEFVVSRNRADFWIIKHYSGAPICVVEVKKPGKTKKSILNYSKVLGQLYDYMRDCRLYYGVNEILGIVTTFKEWRVCWFQDSGHVASSPTCQFPIGDMSETFQDRRLYGSKIMSGMSSSIVPFLMSVLLKASVCHTYLIPLLSNTRKYLQFDKGTERYSTIKFFKNKKPTIKLRFVSSDYDILLVALLRRLGGGRDGTAFLCYNIKTCSACVIKYCNTKELAEKESKYWETVYGITGKVTQLFINYDVPAFIMPYVIMFNDKSDDVSDLLPFLSLPSPTDKNPSEKLYFLDCNKTLREKLRYQFRGKTFKDLGLEACHYVASKKVIHNDVKWNHLGLLPRFDVSGKLDHFDPILIDWADASPCRNIAKAEGTMVQQFLDSLLE